MAGYLLIVFFDGKRMAHKSALDWDEVRRLRDVAIRANARRVTVMKRMRLDSHDEWTAGPHTIWRRS